MEWSRKISIYSKRYNNELERINGKSGQIEGVFDVVETMELEIATELVNNAIRFCFVLYITYLFRCHFQLYIFDALLNPLQ